MFEIDGNKLVYRDETTKAIIPVVKIYGEETGGGGTPVSEEKITYISDETELPESGKIGQKIVLTNDGTKNGEFVYAYEFDGSDWTIYSFAPTARIYYNGNKNSFPQLLYSPATIYEKEYRGYKGLRFEAIDGIPVEVTFSYLEDIRFIRDNDNYIAKFITLYNVLEVLVIDGNFENDNSLYIYPKDYPTPQKELFEIRNCSLSQLNISDLFRNLIIEDTQLNELTFIYSSGNMRFHNVVFSQNTYFNYQYEGPRNHVISIDSCDLGASLNIMGGYYYSEVYTLNLEFVNSILQGQIYIGGYVIESLKCIGNCDTTHLQHLIFSNIEIAPNELTEFLTQILNNGMSSGTLAINAPAVNVDQAIIQAFTERGINVEINQ